MVANWAAVGHARALAPVVEPCVKLPDPLLEMVPTTVTGPKKSTFGVVQPLCNWRL